MSLGLGTKGPCTGLAGDTIGYKKERKKREGLIDDHLKLPQCFSLQRGVHTRKKVFLKIKTHHCEADLKSPFLLAFPNWKKTLGA